MYMAKATIFIFFQRDCERYRLEAFIGTKCAGKFPEAWCAGVSKQIQRGAQAGEHVVRSGSADFK
jgi:hypothetical protein